MLYEEIHVGDVLTVASSDRTYRYRCISKNDMAETVTVKIVSEYDFSACKHIPFENESMFTVDPGCFHFKIITRGTIL